MQRETLIIDKIFVSPRTGMNCYWLRKRWPSSTADGWKLTSLRASSNGLARHHHRPSVTATTTTATTVNYDCWWTVPVAVPSSSPYCSASGQQLRLSGTKTTQASKRQLTRRKRRRRNARSGGGDWWWNTKKNEEKIKKNKKNRDESKTRARRRSSIDHLSSSTRIQAVHVGWDDGLRWIAVRPHLPVASRDSSSVSGHSDGTIGSLRLADIMPITAAVIAEAEQPAEHPNHSLVTIRTFLTKCASSWFHRYPSVQRWRRKRKRSRPSNNNSSACLPIICNLVAHPPNSPACHSSISVLTWTLSNETCLKWWSMNADALDWLIDGRRTDALTLLDFEFRLRFGFFEVWPSLLKCSVLRMAILESIFITRLCFA